VLLEIEIQGRLRRRRRRRTSASSFFSRLMGYEGRSVDARSTGVID
jgi:hypothetical protein